MIPKGAGVSRTVESFLVVSEMLGSMIFAHWSNTEALLRLVGLCLSAEAMWAFRLYGMSFW